MPAPTSPSSASSSQIAAQDCSHDRIAELARELGATIDNAVTEIYSLNSRSRMLSFNAQIEAARNGEAGSTFQVVALGMRELAESIGKAADAMKDNTRSTRLEMEQVSTQLASRVRGTRLSDLALTNIDLIDRNLYERSCDCRWWATDSSLVTALGEKSDAAAKYASKRMGVILNAYTVYYDLVLADLSGRIIANGRPEKYCSQGTTHATADWFRTALATKSGDEFGFQSVHHSSLVGGERALVYSAGVRRDGEARGELLGVLGIVFNWDALAQTIVHNTPLSADETARTRVCIIDDQRQILADSHDRMLQEKLDFFELSKLMTTKKHYAPAEVNGRECIVAHAKSQGFETYATGWHSVIVQELRQQKAGTATRVASSGKLVSSVAKTTAV